MSSGSTGFDTKTYEYIKKFYDTEAWLPKNAVLVNKKAFDALDPPPSKPSRRPARRPKSAAGNCRRRRTAGTEGATGQERHGYHRAYRRTQERPDRGRQRMLDDWLKKAGADGQAMIDTYRKQ